MPPFALQILGKARTGQLSRQPLRASLRYGLDSCPILAFNAVEKGEGRLCSELPASRQTKPLDLESVKDVAGLKC